MKRYSDCSRADGLCGACSRSNRGLDCRNNKIPGLLRERSILGMSKKELSEKSGVNIRQSHRYESSSSDTGNMTLKNALALADALGCDVRDLL